ncbi:MAG: toll/interleukin-1 receptor domain-containing protein [Thiothrix sp.]|nr:MAG: toll/interleukin-1 receptor domain-containing protein [Thiothrix sp.]
MYKQVFISHAREDHGVAVQLYDYLLEHGYSPWLDKRKIRVGANWDYEIQKALKESNFIILLLSSTSVQKRGYIQREFNFAVDYSESLLDDDIYILPILLDKCAVPTRLGKFQWIEINQENSMQQILDSLNYQRDKYISVLPVAQRNLEDCYTTYSIDLNLNKSLKFDYSCSLPKFYENRFFDANFVNTFIHQKALSAISSLRKTILDDVEWINKISIKYLDIESNISFIDENFLSIHIKYDYYFGGVHPTTSVDTLNFAFNPDHTLSFYDVFNYRYGELNLFIRDLLNKYGTKEQKAPIEYNLDYISENNIEFYFSNEFLSIDLTNILPRVALAAAVLDIPLKSVDKNYLKINWF